MYNFRCCCTLFCMNSGRLLLVIAFLKSNYHRAGIYFIAVPSHHFFLNYATYYCCRLLPLTTNLQWNKVAAFEECNRVGYFSFPAGIAVFPCVRICTRPYAWCEFSPGQQTEYTEHMVCSRADVKVCDLWADFNPLQHISSPLPYDIASRKFVKTFSKPFYTIRLLCG